MTMRSKPSHTLMKGDRLDMEILGGQRAGFRTILVSTGTDNRERILLKGIYPDAVIDGLDELVEQWEQF